MDESWGEPWRSEGRRTSSPALALSKQPAWCQGLAGLQWAHSSGQGRGFAGSGNAAFK